MRLGEATPGAGTRSASSHGAQEEGATERPTDRGAEVGEAEQLSRLRKLSWIALGITLWLIAAPLRLCSPGAHTPPSPEPQAPASQQLTESGVAPGARGTLQGWMGEFWYPLKPVGNTGGFWSVPAPGDLMGRAAAHSYSNAHCAPRDTPEEVTDKAHCPWRCGRRGGPLVPGVGATPIQTAPSSPSGREVAPRMASVERSPRSPWVAAVVYDYARAYTTRSSASRWPKG